MADLADKPEIEAELQGRRVRTAFLSVLGAGAGFLVGWRFGHPVLGFIGGGSLVMNGERAASKDITAGDAISNVARTAVATVGSLMMPQAPVAGYATGALVADVAFAGRGTGVILTINEETKKGSVEASVGGSLHMLGAA